MRRRRSAAVKVAATQLGSRCRCHAAAGPAAGAAAAGHELVDLPVGHELPGTAPASARVAAVEAADGHDRLPAGELVAARRCWRRPSPPPSVCRPASCSSRATSSASPCRRRRRRRPSAVRGAPPCPPSAGAPCGSRRPGRLCGACGRCAAAGRGAAPAVRAARAAPAALPRPARRPAVAAACAACAAVASAVGRRAEAERDRAGDRRTAMTAPGALGEARHEHERDARPPPRRPRVAQPRVPVGRAVEQRPRPDGGHAATAATASTRPAGAWPRRRHSSRDRRSPTSAAIAGASATV